MKQLLIYVPGLGGSKTVERQRKLCNKWSDQNTDVLFLQPNWQNAELFDQKLKRLSSYIEDADISSYKDVTIIGSSAGGSLGLNLFNEFKSNGNIRFISICGKLKNVENIGWQYRSKNPALKDSISSSQALLKNLDQKHLDRILSIIPLFDEVVRIPCMKSSGIKIKRQYSIGHVISIGYALIFKSSNFKKFYDL